MAKSLLQHEGLMASSRFFKDEGNRILGIVSVLSHDKCVNHELVTVLRDGPRMTMMSRANCSDHDCKSHVLNI
jgi:hypothetical protein